MVINHVQVAAAQATGQDAQQTVKGPSAGLFVGPGIRFVASVSSAILGCASLFLLLSLFMVLGYSGQSAGLIEGRTAGYCPAWRNPAPSIGISKPSVGSDCPPAAIHQTTPYPPLPASFLLRGDRSNRWHIQPGLSLSVDSANTWTLPYRAASSVPTARPHEVAGRRFS